MIKIVRGTYGYWNGRYVEPKTEKDAPFELEAEKEKRLVDKGVAVYVVEPTNVEISEEGDFEVDGKVVGKVDGDIVEVTDEDVTEATIEDVKAELSKLTLEELKAEGKKYGVSYKVGTKKADFVDQILSAMPAEEEELPDADPADAIV